MTAASGLMQGRTGAPSAETHAPPRSHLRKIGMELAQSCHSVSVSGREWRWRSLIAANRLTWGARQKTSNTGSQKL